MKPQQFLSLMLVASLFLSCSSSSTNPPTDNPTPPKAPKNLITLEIAKEQIDKYKKAHPGVAGDQYALHTWVSIEDLEMYLAYVKNYSDSLGIKVTGIDLIHTQYKDAVSGMPNELNKDYNLTLMYAPTYNDNGKNVAFDPLHSSKGSPATLADLFKRMDPTPNTQENKVDSTATGTEGDGDKPGGPSGIGNHLNSCPETCE